MCGPSSFRRAGAGPSRKARQRVDGRRSEPVARRASGRGEQAASARGRRAPCAGGRARRRGLRAGERGDGAAHGERGRAWRGERRPVAARRARRAADAGARAPWCGLRAGGRCGERRAEAGGRADARGERARRAAVRGGRVVTRDGRALPSVSTLAVESPPRASPGVRTVVRRRRVAESASGSLGDRCFAAIGRFATSQVENPPNDAGIDRPTRPRGRGRGIGRVRRGVLLGRGRLGRWRASPRGAGPADRACPAGA